MLDALRIVLVEPSGPANVGAACRAMANMGLGELVVVRPQCPLDHPDAIAWAAHGAAVLSGARVVDSIPDALVGCVKSFAATSKSGMYRRQASCEPQQAATQARDLAARGRVAFAFGPERTGLVTSDLLHFDAVVTVPANPEYPVLNLAAAVLVVCYELRLATLEAAASGEGAGHGAAPRLSGPDREGSGGAAPESAERGDALRGAPPSEREPLAPDERRRIFFEKLFDALDRIGFFNAQQYPDHLRHALRRVFGRVDLTVNELDILIGMAQQIHWYADHAPLQRDR